MSHVGTGCLMAGFLILASAAGSLSFAAMLSGHVVSGPMRHGLFALFFIGFGVKAGLIPFHVWLPEAHPAAPSSVSAFMSAVLITAGIYGLFRVCAFGLGTPDVNWALVFMSVGTLSAILGVLYALTQTDIKRLLAYSTIENAGIIVVGAGSRDDGTRSRSQHARDRRRRGQPDARAESRDLQGAPVPRRRQRGDGDGHPTHRAVRRPDASHAVDGPVLPGRRDWRFRVCRS